MTATFADFWQLYPKKIARKTAEKAWSKNKCDEIADKVIAALKKQLPHMTDARFIPHPTTWINQGRYDDQLHVEVRPDLPKPKAEREPWKQDDGWKANLNRVLIALVYDAGGVPDDVLTRLLKGRDYYAKQFREMWGETAPQGEFEDIMVNVVAQFRKVIRENPPQPS